MIINGWGILCVRESFFPRGLRAQKIPSRSVFFSVEYFLRARYGIFYVREGIVHVREGIIYVREGILYRCFNGK